MVASILTAVIVGLDALKIEVEVDVSSSGLPSLTIVGLPDKGVQEARDRVKAAIHNSGISMPARKITINLSPSDIPKKGSGFDLPIALGMLTASQNLAEIPDNMLFIGELSLDGSIRRTPGILPTMIMAKKLGIREVFIPKDNATEASIIDGIHIYTPQNLIELLSHLKGIKKLPPIKVTDLSKLLTLHKAPIDMSEIVGQAQAKKALEIAAAGGHNIYFTGMPGAGKTMLAQALSGILPRLSKEESLEITNIYSIAGELSTDQQLVTHRPFRNPHHTTSKVGIIGGGTYPKPGEITLSHRGVLFLDELPEFPRSVIESMRQPLEDGYVQITRANQTAHYPSKCMLVAASNPCPCGFYGHPKKACTCTMSQISRYQKKVSGPMLDRIDIHVHIAAVDIKKLAKSGLKYESSPEIQARVESAHQIQYKRFKKAHKNAHMSNRQIKKYCLISDPDQQFLTKAAQKLDLSARSYYKTLKVARTIADLENADNIQKNHLAQALQYRHTRS